MGRAPDLPNPRTRRHMPRVAALLILALATGSARAVRPVTVAELEQKVADMSAFLDPPASQFPARPGT